MWEKEKLLVTSNFSFSQIVFKKLVLQTRKNQGLFGKGLKALVEKALENIEIEGETSGIHHFLCFPPVFSFIHIFHGVYINLSSANALKLNKFQILSLEGSKQSWFTLYHTIPTFQDLVEESFGKHSVFSFFHSVFYFIKERICHFS